MLSKIQHSRRGRPPDRKEKNRHMRLWDKLGLDMDHHRVIALVGGGGKTTTMYALAREAREAGKTVIVTTTTHILPHPALFMTGEPDPAALRANHLRLPRIANLIDVLRDVDGLVADRSVATIGAARREILRMLKEEEP